MKKRSKKFVCIAAAALTAFSATSLTACSNQDETVTLRVSSWEEYIDLGNWRKDELIEIDNPYSTETNGIIGVNSMIDDFTEWFNGSDNGFKVKVEYSTFGTNEDLYNRLNLGDKYDLVCPSEYMIMKLLNEDKLEKYSQNFFNDSVEENYYIHNVSPFIANMFNDNEWDEYAACYMWGTTGLVYNPETADEQEVLSWDVLTNSDYKHKVTVKDNVRDSYFAALCISNSEKLTSGDITAEESNKLLNATDEKSIADAEDILKSIKENVYSFETDSGKADMITGKVAINFQWSGDGVYIIDQAEEDKTQTELWYSVPYGYTNLWFDGWVMLKDGIEGNQHKQQAAEAFVNYLSRPDNAVRNMYYIGYTSSICGGSDIDNNVILDYLKYNYSAEDDAEETYAYDLSYFFGADGATVVADKSTFNFDADGKINQGRQLFAQYPPSNIIERSVVMRDFGDKLSDINQMWINVRCLDVKDFNPAVVWTVVGIIVAGAVALTLYKFRYKIFIR